MWKWTPERAAYMRQLFEHNLEKYEQECADGKMTLEELDQRYIAAERAMKVIEDSMCTCPHRTRISTTVIGETMTTVYQCVQCGNRSEIVQNIFDDFDGGDTQPVEPLETES